MIEINTTLAPFTLNDQFGDEHKVEYMPKLLICSFQKSTGTLLGEYFTQHDKSYLRQHDILLMADISAVPALLRKTIIIPKMKKYAFRVLLCVEDECGKQFPKEEEKLTILRFENNEIKEILFAGDIPSLQKIIEGE